MKISRDKIIQNGTALLESIVLSGLLNTIKDDAFAEFVKTKWDGHDEVEIQFLVQGVELNIEGVLKRWEKDMDRQIALKANELIAEKFRPLTELLYNMEKDIKKKVKEDLGLELDEYDY